MAITQQPLTLEEFLKLPEEKPALEFRRGKVTQKVSPQRVHAWLQTMLVQLFNTFGLPRKLAMAFAELRAICGGHALVPDVSVYRWERVPFTADDELVDGIADPPDIAVEIVSPDQSVTELVDKCLDYVGPGVEIALLIDPKGRRILRFGSGGVTQALRGNDRIDLASVLPGLELTADDVFALLRRPDSSGSSA